MRTDKILMKPESSEKVIQNTFPVLEMSCAACAVSVESILKSAPGVKNASVNFANQSALVEYDATITRPQDLQNAVRTIGYDLVVNVEDPQAVKEEAQLKHFGEIRKRTIWSLVLSIPVVIIGMSMMAVPYANYISMALTAPVVFYFGLSFFINAWKQGKFGKANMDTLVALSTGIAFLFSAFNTFFPQFWHARGVHPHVYYEAAAVVITFISLGKLLEEKAKSKTSASIKKLMGLQPKTVRLLVGGIEMETKISEVKPGDLILVHPGERIPVDGVVSSGSSFVDEHMISGEAIPIAKGPGEKVFAGTVNQKGSFQFGAQKVGSDTVLANIIKMVERAQGSKAPAQKLADRIAGIFVPVVIGIAIITFTAWMIFGGDQAFTHALLTSVTVLVIACPCALGLATPTAMMVGIGKGAENNILIKDAESLEVAHRVNAVVLDKTGTITEGKPVVTDLIWDFEQQPGTIMKNVLYTIEGQSEHPLAEAVVARLKEEGVTKISVDKFESLTGRGVKASVNNETFYIGNKKLLDENSVTISDHFSHLVSRFQSEAKTAIFFADQHNVLAVIAIADSVKTSSKDAIQALLKKRIDVYMVTGDHAQTAKAVARQVGLINYHAEVLPAAKAAFVKSLQQQGKIVAMVGDGINDAAALAQADVSIAMGKGSDIAMDVADMTLMTSDLGTLHKTLNLSTRIVKTIRQNLFWAFIFNTIGIPLAAGVLYPVNGFLLNPMIAGAAMALSSVAVVSNSLRLKAARL
jgi:Cu2+-exporting ATPase